MDEAIYLSINNLSSEPWEDGIPIIPRLNASCRGSMLSTRFKMLLPIRDINPSRSSQERHNPNQPQPELFNPSVSFLSRLPLSNSSQKKTVPPTMSTYIIKSLAIARSLVGLSLLAVPLLTSRTFFL